MGEDNEKKIRAKVPDFVLKILEKDFIHFGISKETLCNKVFFNFSFNIVIEKYDIVTNDNFQYFQFSLDKINQEYYMKLIEKLQVKNESQFIRNIFLNYALSHSFVREAYLFKEKLKFFQYSIEKENKLRLHTPDGFVEGKVKNIFRDQEIGYILVKLDNDKAYYLSQIHVIC